MEIPINLGKIIDVKYEIKEKELNEREIQNNVMEFVNKYQIDFDTSSPKMLRREMNSGKQKAKAKAFQRLPLLGKEEKSEIIKQYIFSTAALRASIYHQLSLTDQYEITKKYNLYYYLGEKNKWKNIKFLTCEEAHSIMFDDRIVVYLKKDASIRSTGVNYRPERNFAAYLKCKYPNIAKENVENIMNQATFEDFLRFKRKDNTTINNN